MQSHPPKITSFNKPGYDQKKKATTWISSSCFGRLSGYCDSNTGPSGPKPDALTNCATPRLLFPFHLGLQIYDSFLKQQNFL